jgi:hypothetical protein
MANLLETLSPDAAVSVLPRYLAGPGSADLRTAWPFPFDEGWTLHQSDDGTSVASSPCLRLRAGRIGDPDRLGRTQWITAAHEDPFGPATWQITFGPGTPVELLHDIHTELLDLYLEGRDTGYSHPLFHRHGTPSKAYIPLLTRGWGHAIDTDGIQYFNAPDGFCGVEHEYAPPVRPDSRGRLSWKAWAGRRDLPHWTVRFSQSVPVRLAVALTASLLSTEPVEREVKNIPLFTRYAVKSAATATPAQDKPSTPVATPPPRPVTSRTR